MHPIKEYVLKNFFLIYEKPEGVELTWNYINEPGNARLRIQPLAGNYFESLTPPPEAVFKNYLEKEIPFLFAAPGELMEENGEGVLLNDDVPAEIFFWLSGWQELICTRRDEYRRFCYKDSLQYKLNISTLPVVAYLFELLREGFEKAYNISISKKAIYRGGSIAITHDMDRWRRIRLHKYKWSLKNFRPGLLLKTLADTLRRGPYYAGHEQMIKMAGKHGYKSTIFFLTQPGPAGYSQADYRLSNDTVKKTIRRFKDAGHQIGYHFGFDSYDNPEKLKNQMNTGYSEFDNISRFHYLQFDISTGPEALRQAGILLDSTLGFAEHIGFRNGTCHPFFLYLHGSRECSQVLEVPQAAMDVTLSAPKYMNLTPEQSMTAIRQLWNEVEKVEGCMTVNIHNDSYELPHVLPYGNLFDYLPSLSLNRLTLVDFLFLSPLPRTGHNH